jgi:ribosomal protein S18 acetylase RimI-like enzyme
VALLIRNPGEPDIRSIAELHIRSWQFGHQGLFPQSVIDSVSVEERVDSWRETLASPSPGKTVLVAEQDGEIVGFVSSGPSRDRPVEAGAGEIYELFVEPDLVATGVGAALFRESLARLEGSGFRAVTLWVLAGNERARRFYERQALHVDGATRTTTMGESDATEVRYRSSFS